VSDDLADLGPEIDEARELSAQRLRYFLSGLLTGAVRRHGEFEVELFHDGTNALPDFQVINRTTGARITVHLTAWQLA